MRNIVIVAVSLAVVTPAMAQSWPDLVGTWVGKSRAIVAAPGGHYGDASAAEPSFVSAELTVEWTRQDEGRYIGTITSAGRTEPKLAVVAADGKTLRAVDEDGTSTGMIIDENTFELCYAQISPSTVSCVTFTRQN